MEGQEHKKADRAGAYSQHLTYREDGYQGGVSSLALALNRNGLSQTVIFGKGIKIFMFPMVLQVSELIENCDYNLLAALLMIVECFDRHFYRLVFRRFEILHVFRPSHFLICSKSFFGACFAHHPCPIGQSAFPLPLSFFPVWSL